MAGAWEDAVGELVELTGDEVRFRHDLVRVAAYEGLPVRRRREVHRRACDVIEAWGPAAPIADPLSALAFHAAGAERARARPAMEPAGGRRRCDAWCDGGRRAVAARRGGRGGGDGRTGTTSAGRRSACSPRPLSAPGTSTSHRRARRRRAAVAPAEDRARIAVDMARVLEKLGRYRVCAARDGPAPCIRSAARRRRSAPHRAGHRAQLPRDWRGCLRLASALLDREDDGADRRLLAQAHLLAEWCCSCLDLPQRAVHEKAAMELMTVLDDSLGVGNLLLNRGVSAWREAGVDDAIADFRASSEHYRRAGDVVGAAMADNNLAEILTLQGHLGTAEELLRNAGRVARAANYRHGELATISGLSRIAAWRGDVAAASRPADVRPRWVPPPGIGRLRVRLARPPRRDPRPRRRCRCRPGCGDLGRREPTKLGDVPLVPATLARLRGPGAARCRSPGRRGPVAGARPASWRRGDGYAFEVALVQAMLYAWPAMTRSCAAPFRRSRPVWACTSCRRPAAGATRP